MDRSIVKLELSVEKSKFRNLIPPPWACRSFPTLKEFSVKIRGDSNTCDLLMPHMECASLWKLPIAQQVSIVHMACGLYYRFCNIRLFEVHENRMTFSTLEYLKSFFNHLFLFVCMCGCLLVSVCTMHVQCPQRLDEGIGTRVTGSCVVPDCALGTEAGSFPRAASPLHCWAVSPNPK